MRTEKQMIIRAAMKRIGAQFPPYPEAGLMIAIINQACLDLSDKNYQSGAEKYLRHASHADICGIEPAWICETLEKMGLLQAKPE